MREIVEVANTVRVSVNKYETSVFVEVTEPQKA